MVGLPVAGSWTKLGSVLPKALRLAASVLVRVPVPVANQRLSPSSGVIPLLLPISKVAGSAGTPTVLATDVNVLPFTLILRFPLSHAATIVTSVPSVKLPLVLLIAFVLATLATLDSNTQL